MSLFDSQNVFSGYKTSNVLQGVSLQINSGEMVAIIGRNGVGKTTFIKTIIGLIEIRSGEIFFDENRLNNLESFERAKLGIGYVPQGRDIFPQLSVKDNLRMGGFLKTKPSLDFDLVFNYFPFLKDRLQQRGGTLSGGEQQMVAISRALMARPKLLLMDEPSLGLAPLVVREIARSILAINREDKVSVILVEQNSRMALKLSSRAYVLETGRVALEGASEELVNNEDVRPLYLGA